MHRKDNILSPIHKKKEAGSRDYIFYGLHRSMMSGRGRGRASSRGRGRGRDGRKPGNQARQQGEPGNLAQPSKDGAGVKISPSTGQPKRQEDTPGATSTSLSTIASKPRQLFSASTQSSTPFDLSKHSGVATEQPKPQGGNTSGATPTCIEKPSSTVLSTTTSTYKGTAAPTQSSAPFEPRDPPKRPDEGGTLGKKISLSANHFALTIPDGRFIYHYDVQIKPDKCPRNINRLVIKELEKRYADKLQGCKLAYDGKSNIYITKRLPSSIDVCYYTCILHITLPVCFLVFGF